MAAGVARRHFFSPELSQTSLNLLDSSSHKGTSGANGPPSQCARACFELVLADVCPKFAPMFVTDDALNILRGEQAQTVHRDLS